MNNKMICSKCKKRPAMFFVTKVEGEKSDKKLSKAEKEALIKRLTAEMHQAAKILEFEHAAYLRDRIEKLRQGK